MKNFGAMLFAVLLFGCAKSENEKLILVSKDNHHNIETWLTELDGGLIVKEAYNLSADSVKYYLMRADGIIIGGGEDVHPSHYNKMEYIDVCGDIDEYRDTLEFILINFAMEKKVPLLGICRGQQIINVANGGTLIPDIPSYITTSINHSEKSKYNHKVGVVPDSWLSEIIKLDTFMINSRHHQAVDEIAPNFKIAAYAPDSIIESIEIKNKTAHPFATGVQWHPESLRDSISNIIGEHYIKAIYKN